MLSVCLSVLVVYTYAAAHFCSLAKGLTNFWSVPPTTTTTTGVAYTRRASPEQAAGGGGSGCASVNPCRAINLAWKSDHSHTLTQNVMLRSVLCAVGMKASECLFKPTFDFGAVDVLVCCEYILHCTHTPFVQTDKMRFETTTPAAADASETRVVRPTHPAPAAADFQVCGRDCATR